MARIPKLDAAGKFLAADVNAQIDARTKATMRADLPALAKELKIGSGSGIEQVSGTVTLDASGAPIREFFTTGATTFKANGADTLISSFTALVWRRSSTGSWGYQIVQDAWVTPAPTPDTTAPVAGTLSVAVTDVKADLTVSGASDNRAVTGYSFSKDNGSTWTAYQDSSAYTFTGLTPSTAYQFRHRVKDAAGNVTTGTAVSKTTNATPPWGTIYSDGFDGSTSNTEAVGRAMPVGGKTWQGTAGQFITTSSGLLKTVDSSGGSGWALSFTPGEPQTDVDITYDQMFYVFGDINEMHFRRTDAKNFVKLAAQLGNNGTQHITLSKVVDGVTTELGKATSSTTPPVSTVNQGVISTLRVAATGTTAEVYQGSTLLFSATGLPAAAGTQQIALVRQHGGGSVTSSTWGSIRAQVGVKP